MANETKNQEFNKSIKQLQSMVKDKMLINLAEKYFNLKSEMNNLARAVKEKETKLLIEESQQQAKKEQEQVSQIQEKKPEIVSAPQKPEVVVEPQQTKQENNRNKNQNFSKQQLLLISQLITHEKIHMQERLKSYDIFKLLW